MSFYTLIKFGVVSLLLLNLVGYLRHLTFDYWNKPTSDKEILVENCENIFTLINDIHHYAKASKIKVHEHLSCYQKNIPVKLEGIFELTCNHKIVKEATGDICSHFRLSVPKAVSGYLKVDSGLFTDVPEITDDCARLKRYPISQNKILIVFDGKVSLRDAKGINFQIGKLFFNTLSFFTCIMFSMDCYDETSNDYFYISFFIVIIFFLTKLCCSIHLRDLKTRIKFSLKKNRKYFLFTLKKISIIAAVPIILWVINIFKSTKRIVKNMKKLDTDSESDSSDSSDDEDDQIKVESVLSTASNSQIVLRQAAALDYPTSMVKNEEKERPRTRSIKLSKSKKSSKKSNF